MGVPWLDLKPQRPGSVSPLGSVVVGRFVGEGEPGFVRVAVGSDDNVVNVPHGGGVFPVGGPVSVQLDADGVPMGVLAGVDAGGETVALGATGKAIERQGDKLGKDIEAMDARVKAAAEGPVDTGRLTAGEVLIKGDLIAGDTVGARHIVASEELEAKLASFRKVTTDELVAGNAKISGSLLADVIEGKTLKGTKIDGGTMVLRPENTPRLELHVESDAKNHIPIVALRRTDWFAGDPVARDAFLVTAVSDGGADINGQTGFKASLQLSSYDTSEVKPGRNAYGEITTLDVDADGVTVGQGSAGPIRATWEKIIAAANAHSDTPVTPKKTHTFRDLDRDWRREPRPFEVVREAGSDVVDLFGGEWVRQNSEWNYTGNTWFEWKLGIPTELLPKQWVHFTVVITEDNFPHFAQGQIRPDGTFALKLDKGIRVKPNVSRIMIPPVRWHL